MKDNNLSDKYGSIIKVLQILSFIIMLVMVVFCAVFLSKNNISIRNVDALTQYLTGGTATVILIIVGFSVIKSFALIFPPAVLFVLSGVVFEDFITAFLVNALATACSLILPYFLGRFTGMEMVNSLKKRFKAIKKLDDFTDANSTAVVFIFKAGGLIPSDLSSLIFGAMNIPFVKYFFTSNIGMLVLNFLWTLVGSKGDLTNPLSYLYALPALIFALVASLALGAYNKKKNKTNKENIETEEIR